MSAKVFLVVGALSGFLSVGLGAFVGRRRVAVPTP